MPPDRTGNLTLETGLSGPWWGPAGRNAVYATGPRGEGTLRAYRSAWRRYEPDARRRLFCAITKVGRPMGQGLSNKAVWQLIKQAEVDARLAVEAWFFSGARKPPPWLLRAA